jgi:diacylglycerol kinase family enzyme
MRTLAHDWRHGESNALSASVLVIVNAGSGTLSAEDERAHLRKLLDEAGLRPTVVHVMEGSSIAAAVDRDSSEVVVAAGGDGTINAVAARLIGTERTLGVIPGGTLNHFAKDLGIPQDFEGAVAVLRAGKTRQVDVAELNGRPFLNNSSLGMYPQIVREREKIQRHGFRKWTAFAGALARVLMRWPVVRVRLEVNGRVWRRRTPFVFVGNNRYLLEGLRMGSRERLDGRELCLCVARSMSRFGLARMAVRGFMGGLRSPRDLDVVCAAEAWVRTRRREVEIAIDGEVTRMEAPLHYVIRPGALRVIAP